MGSPPKENNLFEGGVITEAAMLAYLGNQLSAEDKAQFEKLLHDDPFAQDALEGLQAANAATASAKISSIKKQVREKTGVKEARVIQLHWTTYAYAAAIFGVLIGIGFFMVNYIAKNNTELAQNKTQPTENVQLLEADKSEPAATETEAPANVLYDSVSTKGNSTITSALEEKPLKLTEDARKDVVTTTDVEKKSIQKEETKNITTAGGAVPAPSGNTIQPANEVVSFNMADDNATSEDKSQKTIIVTNTKAPTAAKPDTKAKMSTDSYTVAETIAAKERAKTENKTVTLDDAMKNFNGGNYQQSSEQFEQILKQDPESAEALYFGGISDYILGNTKKSEKNFDKLLKTNRYNEGSKWYKANILLKKGNKAEAKKLLEDIAQGSSSYKERAQNKLEEMK